jgi:hypothetical protein
MTAVETPDAGPVAASATEPGSAERAGELAALRVWLSSRLAVVVLTLGGAALLSGAQAGAVEPFLTRWDRWDVGLFRKVAEFGYQGYPTRFPDKGVEAFFPGEPLLLRALHLLVPNWIAAGLVLSLLAGAAASIALGRLAAAEGIAPGRAVLYLVLSPYAVFLAAGYSEALFLACALWGWLLAKQGRWVPAALLVAAATTVRVNGVFLAVALIVEYAVAHRGRLRPDAVALLAPFAAVAAYVVYLHALTGDWQRWQHAQAEGWGRHLVSPVSAFTTTLSGARNAMQGAEYAWSFRAEILAVAVGLALTVALLVQRRWGEMTYIGLSLAALATSTFYLSVARGTLLWWPLFLLLARAGQRRAWLHTAYVWTSAPLMALFVLTFTSGRWVD